MHARGRLTPWLPASLVTALLLQAAVASGEPAGATEPSALPEPAATASPSEVAAPEWSLSIAAATYIVPDTRVYEQPTLTADRDWLHLEARYNYESLDTGSAWLGYNFSAGERLTLAVTPMVGGVFGNTTGVAPGCRLTLGFWKLELYTEGEYLFDTDDHTGDFGYAWSELTLTPLEWLRFGLVSQRTNAYQADVEIQRGLLVGLAYRWLSFTTYVFNLDQRRQTVVLTLGAAF